VPFFSGAPKAATIPAGAFFLEREEVSPAQCIVNSTPPFCAHFFFQPDDASSRIIIRSDAEETMLTYCQ
jgi:hypothetical protein